MVSFIIFSTLSNSVVSFFLNIVEIKTPGSKYWLKICYPLCLIQNTTKNIWIHVICMQVLAYFITPPPYFERVSIISMLSGFFLITICSHCFQYVFIDSV